jgi:group II intron reverse transcriptase/maturase
LANVQVYAEGSVVAQGLLASDFLPRSGDQEPCEREFLGFGAPTGVDEVSWDEYGERLDERLLDLENRIHRGSYHPQPVRRVHIPKGDGRTRPLGIPTLEDKIVQQAVQMVLEPIYEAEFIGISYGFRPGRSQHDALDALAVAIEKRVRWVLDADIEAFFDTIDHRHLQAFLEHRIGDTRMVRLLISRSRCEISSRTRAVSRLGGNR